MTTYAIWVDDAETVVTAADMPDALRQAKAWALAGDWDTDLGTVWVDLHAQRDACADDGEEVCPCAECSAGLRSFAIHPEEPECTGDSDHAWASPHELVRGVQGSGGGVVCSGVCMRCGCSRTTDSWAQRPDTGEQGLLSISYEEGRYDLTEALGEIHAQGACAEQDHAEGEAWSITILTPPEPWLHRGVLVTCDDEESDLTWCLDGLEAARTAKIEEACMRAVAAGRVA